MLVTVGTRSGAHSLRSQVGIGSESDCLLAQSEKIFRISDSKAGVKRRSQGVFQEKTGLEMTRQGCWQEKDEV